MAPTPCTLGDQRLGCPVRVRRETIREFAADQLAASGEGDEQRGRHLEHYRDLADQIFEDDTETTVLSAETDSIRAAIAWAHDQGCVRDELVMASAVALHWAQIGLGAEAHERLAQAVSEYRTADALRARGLWVLGFLLMILGHEQAEQTLHDAMSVAIACGDLMWHAQALDTLANLMLDTDLDAARQLLDQSIALPAI